MKLRDMFISEEQLATDSLIREVIEEEWLKEARSERTEEPEEEEEERHSSGDDFGDEPDEFVDKDTSYLDGDDDDEDDGEFRGAPADPMLAPKSAGFEDEPDASTFSDEPVFGEIPEPSADPESPLWHGQIDLDEPSEEHRSSVSFPDYEGPSHRSFSQDDKPDEKGFYPRPKTSKTKKSRR